MKLIRNSYIQLALFIPLIVLVYMGCSSTLSPTYQQLEAIYTIRTIMELPELPLEFIKTTGMINSPSGNLKVALYQDPDGRKFYFDPETNQVVEIDARSILSDIPTNTASMSEKDLKVRAVEYITAIIPDFESLHKNWMYEEGNKGDYYFFTWYSEIEPGAMNRPFAQIGLHKSGVLFAYYNTLLLGK